MLLHIENVIFRVEIFDQAILRHFLMLKHEFLGWSKMLFWLETENPTSAIYI